VKLAIAVPTYNEAANLKKLIPAISKSLKTYPNLTCTLFIVDDNSPDGTAEVADELEEHYKSPSFKMTVLRRKRKDGLGKAYIYAFNKILSMKFDYIVQMDADLSHDPKYLPVFLDATKHADFVVGSRYIQGGKTPDWSLRRKLLSQGGNLYTRLFLGSRIADYTGGYNLYSAALLHKLDSKKLQSSGYGFLIELKYMALQQCHGVVQVPIVFMDRKLGVPKIPRGTLIKNLLLVPKLRLNHAMDVFSDRTRITKIR
jgi:dolichol-phosphate mannosyltransferase